MHEGFYLLVRPLLKQCKHDIPALSNCFVEGVELTKASANHSSIMIRGQKNNAKHCKHVWIGPRYCFVEGVELTKASVDHPSIMIRGQKTMPNSANMCGLGHGIVLWRVWSSPKRL